MADWLDGWLVGWLTGYRKNKKGKYKTHKTNKTCFLLLVGRYLVVGGPLVMKLANDNAAKIIPVDSEHSAVFQALQGAEISQVKRIILTASGGPFLHHTQDQLDAVTVEEALAHPTWQMGPKITVDSATMMN